MPSVRLESVSLSFGDRTLMNEVSIVVSAGDRIALTGINGSGKTTIMRMLAGMAKPDMGTASRERGTRVSYLPQSGLRHEGRTLFQEADKAFHELESVVRRMEEIEGVLHAATTADSQLLTEYGLLQERVIDSGYFHRREVVERVLEGLGFRHADMDRETSSFSAGWQMRIALGKVLLERPDIMLLDEPTNYLDLEARTWLEEELKSYKGGLMLVSHDRYFLDVVCTSVAEIYLGRLLRRRGTFTEYEKARQVELEGVIKAYRLQQEEIERIEAFIRRFRYTASRARMVQERIRYLEKLERIEIPPGLKSMRFSFPQPPHSGKLSLEAQGITKSYGADRVLHGLDLEVARGERLVVVGPNGAGKSTLLRILGGRDKADGGVVRYGSGIKIGYFSQEHTEGLDPEATVEQAVERAAHTEQIPQLRGMLGAFLFRGDDVYKPVRVLSGGEASRLSLLTLLLEPVNLLILDEPTNHLDLTSKDVLLDALREYTGTLLFVSHDRYFIEQLATRVLDLTGRKARMYYGDYAYYLWRKDAPEESQTAETLLGAAAGGGATAGTAAGGQPDRTEQRRRKGELARLEREETEVVEGLGRLHGERERLEGEMTREEIYRDAAKMREIKKRLQEIEEEEKVLTARWERVETAKSKGA